MKYSTVSESILPDYKAKNGYPVYLYRDWPVVIITGKESINGYIIIEEVKKVGVNADASGCYSAEAVENTKKLALQWFAEKAIKLGGNAVIEFKELKGKNTSDFDREDRTTGYDYEGTFTGVIVKIQAIL